VAEPAEPRSCTLLDIPFSLTDYDGALARIAAMVAERRRGYLCCTSVHGLMVSRGDAEMAAALRGAALNLPDGMPVVWALNRLCPGPDLGDRVYGPALMERACEQAAREGHRIFLYGSHDDRALAELTGALRRRWPGLAIAGAWSPPHRDLSEPERGEVGQRIDASGADVVWCGISTPRQEKWLAAMRPLLEAPVLISVGAAFDFLAGRVAQAPPWMQRHGLEWAYRTWREPRRLGPRYLRNNPAFIAAVARQYLRERRG